MKGILYYLTLTSLVTSLGCGHKNDQVTRTTLPASQAIGAPSQTQAPAQDPHGPAAPAGDKPKVVVKNTQNAKWKGITVSVHNLATGKDDLRVIGPKKMVDLPGTDLAIKVLNIVSDFVMEHGVIQPGSDTMRNPAAQVELYEKGKLIWTGWLFREFPDDRKFDHDHVMLRLMRIEPSH